MKRWLIIIVFIAVSYGSIHLADWAYGQPVVPGGTWYFQFLHDSPGLFTGNATKHVRVNAAGTKLEYVTLAGGGDMDKATYDTDADSLIDQAAGGTELDTSGVTDGQLLIGTTAGNVWALGTLTGTANEIDIANAGGSITIGLVNPLSVAKGGTGATTLTDGGILLGSGAGAITALGVATNGQIPIGDGATDPVLATISEGLAIDITNGAGSISTAFDPTELLGNITWGDGSTDTIVWTWNRATGTDTTITFNSGSLGFQAFTSAGPGSVGTYFDITPTASQAHSEGRMFYDSDVDTFVMYNAESDVSLNVGEEHWAFARNATGSTITDGQVVYFSGATGGRPNIILAKADAAATSFVAGIATHDIENNTDGYVTCFGLVRGAVNTIGMSGGDQLYLSAATAGALTVTPPTPPDFIVMVAQVMTVNANGDIFVSPQLDYTDGVVVDSLNTVGDITIHGDDLFMATNTDKALLVADGTNFNPVVSTGDVIISNDGSSAIQANAVNDTHIDWGTGANQVAAADIPMAVISGSTYSTVQEMQNIFHSAGWVSGGGITNDTDGTITVAAGTGLIRATNTSVAEIVFFDWSAESGANVNLADTDTSYVYAEYNSGTPRVVATTTVRTDFHTNVLLATIYRDGTDLHINAADKHSVGDHANSMIRRLVDTMPYGRKSGGILSETGTRNIAITAGEFWRGLTEFSTSAINTSASETFSYYHLTGTWQKLATHTQVDNTQYSNEGVALATLSNNKYGVHWVYIEADDDDTAVLYGIGDYTLAEAENAQPPSSVPEHLEVEGILAGKIIIKKSDSAFTQTESAFQTTFQGSLATDHGSLAGLADTADHPYALLIDGTRALAGAWDMASQALTNVNIDSGVITGITDLAVADGGTGASNLNDLITLTTHTTGNYAAGDAEAGAATNIQDRLITELDLNLTNSPTDNYVLSYNLAATNFTWVAAGGFDSTTIDDTTWSDGSNAANTWTFDVSGTNHTMAAGNGIMTFSHDIGILGDNIEATTETDRFVWMANGSTYAPEALDLGTDTTGNYVASITDGDNGIDGGDGGSEAAGLTLSLDTTEVDATTWSDGLNASNIWTFDVAGTNHTMTAGNGKMTFGDEVEVTDTLTATDGLELSDSAKITQSADTYVTITENSDTLQVLFDGSSITLINSDGGLFVQNAEDGIDAILGVLGKDAGEKGILAAYSDGSDKWVLAYHDDTDGYFSSSSGDIYLVAAGGDIQLGDENIVTTGTLSSGTITTASNIKSEPKHMVFNIINPLATQTEDNEICLWPVTPAALTVTKIVVTLNSAANEVAGDLKYADTFIGLANPVVINTFDTTAGVLSDDSITSGSVAAGKAIYIAFDSAPNTAITQMCVDITWDFD